ncbi:MAG: paraquat-inducible protein A [Pseudomonadota bacterium]
MRVVASLLLLLSALCLPLGLTLPLLHLQKLYFFSDTPSLVDVVLGLWEQGSIVIAVAVTLFSCVFPLAKLALTFVAAVAPKAAIAQSSIIATTGALAKWSMMDVLLVAIVIFAAKSSGFATAFAQPGLWFYGASALSGAVAAALLKQARAEVV